MLFLNRVYFYSNYIKKVLISSVLVFLFSYSFYSVGAPESNKKLAIAKSNYKDADAATEVTRKALRKVEADHEKALRKSEADYEEALRKVEADHTKALRKSIKTGLYIAVPFVNEKLKVVRKTLANSFRLRQQRLSRRQKSRRR